MSKKLHLRVSGKGVSLYQLRKMGLQLFLKKRKEVNSTFVHCKGAKNYHWLSTYYVLGHFHTPCSVILCSCYLTNKYFLVTSFSTQHAWVKKKNTYPLPFFYYLSPDFLPPLSIIFFTQNNYSRVKR